MAATLTTSLANYTDGPLVRKYTLAWVSHTDGVVNLNTSKTLVGELVRVVFAPGAGGVQPDDLYDLTLLDGDGIDVLAGQGANLTNAAPTHIVPGVPFKDGTTVSLRPVTVHGTLNLVIANAGSGKSGSLTLYVR